MSDRFNIIYFLHVRILSLYKFDVVVYAISIKFQFLVVFINTLVIELTIKVLSMKSLIKVLQK